MLNFSGFLFLLWVSEHMYLFPLKELEQINIISPHQQSHPLHLPVFLSPSLFSSLNIFTWNYLMLPRCNATPLTIFTKHSMDRKRYGWVQIVPAELPLAPWSEADQWRARKSVGGKKKENHHW